MANRSSLEPFFATRSRPTVSDGDMTDVILLGGWVSPPGHSASFVQRRQAAAIADSLNDGSGRPERCFDPAHAICRLIERDWHEADSFWRTRYVPAGRSRVRALAGSGDQTPTMDQIRALPDRHFAVHFRRTFQLSPLPGGGRRRLRLPRPVEDAQLENLTIAIDPLPPGVELKIFEDRLEARIAHDMHGALTVGAHFAFTAAPGRPYRDPGANDSSLFLKEKEGAVQVTAAVRNLADRLAGPSVQGMRAIGKFWDYLMDEMTCGPVPHDRIGDIAPVDWTIGSRWFDCHIGTALLVALCRAKGIPARMLGGYLLFASAPMEHFWMEALIEGKWTPIDLLSWDLSSGGTDAGWRDLFFGTTDYRMKTQRFPDHFTGPLGIPFPPEWHRVSRATVDGVQTDVVEIPDGRLVMRDSISVV